MVFLLQGVIFQVQKARYRDTFRKFENNHAKSALTTQLDHPITLRLQ